MDHTPKIGICVPNTIRDKAVVLTMEKESYIKIKSLGKREGWAFTIRTEIAKKFYPIPSELKMFFGDDYLFDNTRKQEFEIVKMFTNPIYHYGSVTLESNLGDVKSIELLKKERKIWEEIKNGSK
jgi:hypothetical protein